MRIVRLLGSIGTFILLCTAASPARAETFRVGRLLCFSTPRVGLVLDPRSRCAAYSMHNGRSDNTSMRDASDASVLTLA